LLFDLLTAKEDEDYEKRFDIELLTRRLVEVTDWAATYPATRALSVGYFGASTGAASAMFAAAKLDGRVKAVVSRGGRTDLALSAVPQLQAPTLLIVGSLDRDLVSMNKMVFEQLLCEKEFTLVKGATHLFQEPGKLEEVAELAARWFESHL
jgi:dienelactone hydrolase